MKQRVLRLSILPFDYTLIQYFMSNVIIHSLKHEQEVSEEELHQYLLQGVHQLEWIFSSTKAIGQQFYDGNPVWNKRMMTENEIIADLNNNTIFVTAYSFIHDFFVQSKYNYSIIDELLLWFSDLCDHCQSIDYLHFSYSS